MKFNIYARHLICLHKKVACEVKAQMKKRAVETGEEETSGAGQLSLNI